MPNTNRNKGSSYERQLAKFLSDLYQESFIRVQGSGAYLGGKNQHRTSYLSENQQAAHRGDLVGPDDWVNFNCELKAYKEFSFNKLFTDYALLNGWIDQVLTVSRPDDVNVVFFKINRAGQYVCVQDFPRLVKTNSLQYKTDWYIFDLETFFTYNKDSLKHACAKR